MAQLDCGCAVFHISTMHLILLFRDYSFTAHRLEPQIDFYQCDAEVGDSGFDYVIQGF